MTAPDLAAEQRDRAARFLRLHQGPRILLLPNAWDAASARLLEEAGCSAVATTSAGLAHSLGFPDGERAPFPEVIAAIARIVRVVRVPVTTDLETGFGKTPEEVARNCRAAAQAGSVGVNLEDGSLEGDRPLIDVALACDKIQAVREAVAGAGLALVINARTDVYLRGVGELETRLAEAIRRCQAYRAAGADCLFVPGVTDPETIGRLAREVGGPLNILAGPAAPPVAELSRLGVARVSLGSGPMRATLGLLRSIAMELLGPGTYSALSSAAIPYDEANELFTRR
jgi:2-methylisocitrate lyase-like PEP mutase family enzyme